MEVGGKEVCATPVATHADPLSSLLPSTALNHTYIREATEAHIRKRNAAVFAPVGP